MARFLVLDHVVQVLLDHVLDVTSSVFLLDLLRHLGDHVQGEVVSLIAVHDSSSYDNAVEAVDSLGGLALIGSLADDLVGVRDFNPGLTSLNDLDGEAVNSRLVDVMEHGALLGTDPEVGAEGNRVTSDREVVSDIFNGILEKQSDLVIEILLGRALVLVVQRHHDLSCLPTGENAARAWLLDIIP